MEKTLIEGQIFNYKFPLYEFLGGIISEKMPYNFDIYDKNTNLIKGTVALYSDDEAEHKISDMYFHLSVITPENASGSRKFSIQLETFLDLKIIAEANLEAIVSDFEQKILFCYSWLSRK